MWYLELTYANGQKQFSQYMKSRSWARAYRTFYLTMTDGPFTVMSAVVRKGPYPKGYVEKTY